MSVYFIFGKPGGGKSLLAFHRILHELRFGKRTVITNVPILPDKLAEFLQTSYPNESVDVLRRLRLIEAEQLGQWFRYRGRMPTDDGSLGRWVDLPPPHCQEKIKGKPTDEATPDGATDFSLSPGPVFYTLDEIHIRFNARSWQSTGPGALYYLSQHRKLGDDVLLISQTPAQVDKQLRSLSQEWIHVTNLGKMRTGLFWTLPRRMLWRSYASLPTPGEPIMMTGILKAESPGWADCYETASGVGMAGTSGADKADRQKGPSVFLGAILLAALVVLSLKYVPEIFAGVFDRLTGKATAQVKAPPAATPTPTPEPSRPPPQEVELSPAVVPEFSEGAPVIGYYRIGSRSTYVLSDGAHLEQTQVLRASPSEILTKTGTRHVVKTR